jgi:hypothetical protein
MVGSRPGWCVACLLAGCFTDIEPGDSGGGTQSTSDPSSTSMDATSDTPTSTSIDPGTTLPTTSPTTASAEASSSPDTDTTTLEVTSDDPLTSASSGSPGDCHTLDFEGVMGACAVGVLALPIGPYQVGFANALETDPTICIEDVGGADMLTAPLTGHYVHLQIHANSPATLTFDAPVKGVTFAFGPRHMQGTAASTSICVNTAGSCDNTTAFANDDLPATVDIDVAGNTVVNIYQTKGVGHIGLDDLHVCFE